ncbi:LysR family transcriptional regulator [Parasedimentitalea psychrophila]|uniref:LysR family transcriptional regulator n=1 Tax=Parasedimentitalea psychrophila TaxID=2997337 RepID=A0A9Y2P6X1_9RHOB|nr:LysR family transcriptional regulator [Parasedimentitalea psychrophila]WIY25170.1 LysR family transcriptional regulator [Parasedimentitalea psychrophila]
MRITARQIELFQMAYRHRSTRKAANALNISQPAISRAVADLEAEMAVALFDRAGRKFEPTAAAHSLSAAIRSHYYGIDRVVEAASLIASGTFGVLNVVALPAVADTVVARAAATLMARHSKLRIDIDVMGEQECLAMLRSGNADCAVICSSPSDAGFTSRLIREIRPVAALSAEDPLAAQREVSLQQLAENDLVMLPPDSPFRRALELELAKSRISFSVRAEVRTQSALAEYVISGIGRGVIDPLTGAMFSAAALVLRPLRASLIWPINLVAPASTMALPVTQLLLDELKPD